MTLPDGLPIPAATATTCADLQSMGDEGEIPPSMCTNFQLTVQSDCGCEEDTFAAAEVACSVCGIPGFVIVADDETSMCASMKEAASQPDLHPALCAELTHFTEVLECDCQLIGDSSNEIASDIPSDIPSYFPSDAPSDVPSDVPSMAPTLIIPEITGPYPVCNLCGDLEMGNPEGFPIPGAYLTSCSLLQRQGSKGLVPESICSELTLNAVTACACGESTFEPEESCALLDQYCTTDDECCGDDTACIGFCTIGKKDTIETAYPRLPVEDRGGLRARHY